MCVRTDMKHTTPAKASSSYCRYMCLYFSKLQLLLLHIQAFYPTSSLIHTQKASDDWDRQKVITPWETRDSLAQCKIILENNGVIATYEESFRKGNSREDLRSWEFEKLQMFRWYKNLKNDLISGNISSKHYDQNGKTLSRHTTLCFCNMLLLKCVDYQVQMLLHQKNQELRQRIR